MAVAVRASILAAAALAAVAPARAQSHDGHSHLIPLPHPEILQPNEPALPPSTLHPRVFHARPPPSSPASAPDSAATSGAAPSPASGVLRFRLHHDRNLTDGRERTGTGPPQRIAAPLSMHRAMCPGVSSPVGIHRRSMMTRRIRSPSGCQFARDGSIIGKPFVTYVKTGPGTDARQAMVDSIQAALQQCTPLDFAPGLGAAIAGYPFAIRFILAHGDDTTRQR